MNKIDTPVIHESAAELELVQYETHITNFDAAQEQHEIETEIEKDKVVSEVNSKAKSTSYQRCSSLLKFLLEDPALFSFCKLVLVIIYGLGTNTQWSYCNKASEGIAYTCYFSSPDDFEDECQRNCGLGGSASSYYDPNVKNPYYSGGSYICEVPNSCMCIGWVVGDLILIVLNLLHFFIQLIFFFTFGDFNPQQKMFDLVNSKYYGFCESHAVEVLFCPTNCILPILESAVFFLAVVKAVLGQHTEDKGDCNAASDGNSLGIILLTAILLSESYKANFDRAIKALKQSENSYFVRLCWALEALLRVDIALVFATLMNVQGAIGTIYICTIFPFCLWRPKQQEQDYRKVHESHQAKTAEPELEI